MFFKIPRIGTLTAKQRESLVTLGLAMFILGGAFVFSFIAFSLPAYWQETLKRIPFQLLIGTIIWAFLFALIGGVFEVMLYVFFHDQEKRIRIPLVILSMGVSLACSVAFAYLALTSVSLQIFINWIVSWYY